MNRGEMLFGLIGFPLHHSWSATYFNDKFSRDGDIDKEYRLFPLESISEFHEFLRRNPTLSGLNVTIPYKVKIIPYLDALDETARLIGAVNTIMILRDKERILTKGYNTDAAGFFQTINDQTIEGPALILGTGGAAKAVAHALNMKNIRFTFVSRQPLTPSVISYAELTKAMMESHPFIINTTPLGMHPDTGSCPPVPYHFLTAGHFLYDLVYNPVETEFLKRGKSMNAVTRNGLQMLINQAELSLRIFLNIS
jgi:shikimate dehydrogenase